MVYFSYVLLLASLHNTKLEQAMVYFTSLYDVLHTSPTHRVLVDFYEIIDRLNNTLYHSNHYRTALSVD